MRRSLLEEIRPQLTCPVDYILFCTLDVTMEPNMNEVSDAKYVSKDELEAMFTESSKLPSSI